VATTTAATLLERERELVEVDSALTEAGRGHGQVVLVEAPAGLGKTSLLRAAAEAAAGAGFTCLRARATAVERDFAYGCVRQLLEPAVASSSETDHERLFEGVAVLSKPLFTPAGGPEPVPSGDGSFAMLHGLYWLLNNLTEEGPVALLVDDLQWSDTESLRFLNYLAPRLDGLPLAVVAATRSGEMGTADLARLAAGPETTVLRPEPLSTEATATLCEQRLGAGVAPEFSGACREATGGNPFYLEALLRDASEQGFSTGSGEVARVHGIGPAAVARAVLLRLSGRPAAATAQVHAVAVLGDGASLAEAADLAGLSREEAVGAADLLVALAILRPAEGLEFAHPIIREAVHADIGPRERARSHARGRHPRRQRRVR
jgi:AAA ATPase domain